MSGNYPIGPGDPQCCDWPYPIRYAWAATRGLPLPAPPLVLTDSRPRQSVRQLSQVRVWTAEEDAIVRAEYANRRMTKTVPSLAKQLNRSTCAVTQRARILHVAESRPWQGRKREVA